MDKNNNNNNNNNNKNLPPKLFTAPPQLDDCDRPACDDTVSALSAAFARIQSSSSSSSSSTTTTKEGPINKDELGKSTWNLLHTMAAWYPDTPTKEDETFMKNFMEGLGRFYPCTYCAHDFRIELEKSPPRTKSRKELSIWLCEQHNIVNKKIHTKNIFPCDLESLDRRWREKKEG